MFFKKKIKQKPNIVICSLLDVNAEVRAFFDVEADCDEKLPMLYFSMYDIKDKKKKRMSDIIVDCDTRKDELFDLIKFLRDWNFKKFLSYYYLSCNCETDLFKFMKLKKEYFNDKEDNMYICYFSSGGNFKRKQTIEVNITKDQAKVLASQLESFLNSM